MALPYTITAGNQVLAAPVQGNFEDLDGRVVTLEGITENVQDNAALYGNGVFYGSLTAAEVGTSLVYTSGTFILNGVFYYKIGYTVNFAGYGAATYYVEVPLETLQPAIYASKGGARINLNTVSWNGTSFNSSDEADRTVLYGFTHFITSVGKPGGQTINGGQAAGEDLTLSSTAHATKGKVKLGTASAYDQVNDRLGVGTQSPSVAAHVIKTTEQLRLGYDAANYVSVTVGSAGSTIIATTGANSDITLTPVRNVVITDGKNIAVGTSTGTQIGTAADQKIAAYGAAPVVQATTAGTEAVFSEEWDSGVANINEDSTFDGYTLAQVVKALRNFGILA